MYRERLSDAAGPSPVRKSARRLRGRNARITQTSSESDAVEAYQLECSVTGYVKMYKHMSSAEARVLDRVLLEQGSTSRWRARGGPG